MDLLHQSRQMIKWISGLCLSGLLSTSVLAADVSIQAYQAMVQQDDLSKAARPETATKALISFDDGMILPILMAERAFFYRDYQTAFNIYWVFAKETQNPQFAEQAARILVTEQARQPQTSAPTQYRQLKDAADYWFDLDSKSMAAFGLMIDAHLLTGDIQSLPAILQKAIQRNPQLIERYWQALREHFKNIQQGAIMRALVLIEDLAKGSEDQPQAWVAVAETAIRAGKYDLALSCGQKAAALSPEWDEPVLLQAEMLLGDRKEAEAIHLLTSYADSHPDQAKRALLLLGDIYLDAEEYSKAFDIYTELAQWDPTNGELMMQAGQLGIKVENYLAARTYLQRALTMEVEPEAKDQARFWLVQIASTLKQFDDEPVSLIEQISDPKIQQITLFSYASELYNAGKTKEANRLMQRFYYKFQTDTETELNYGYGLLSFYRQTQQMTNLKFLLEDLLKKNPDNPYLMYDAGMLAEQAGQLAKFESIFKRILQLEPSYAHAYNALGYSYVERGIKLKEARKLLSKAIELAPDDPFIQDSMGWLAFKEKNYTEAITWLTKAFQIRQEAEILAHLGEVYWAMGDKNKALEIWKQGLSTDPEHKVLLQTILRLNGKPL